MAFPWKPSKQVWSVATILLSESLYRNEWTVLGWGEWGKKCQKRETEALKEEDASSSFFFLQTLRRWPAPALCCQEPSPVTFSFRIYHQMPTSDHSHLPPASQVRKSLWRASRRFAAAVIFLYEDIAKQKRTNVAKICKMKTILRCLRDLAFRGVIGSVMPLCLPSEVDHCSPGLCYTRSPCSLTERV